MKVLMFNKDKGGLKQYSEFLVRAMKAEGFEVTLSDKIKGYDFDVIDIQFEHTLFHPFGLRLIPLLILLKMHRKKIVITSHTTLSRKEIYSRNKILTLIKKVVLPLDEKLMGLLANKIIVHTEHAKNIMINDYKIPYKKLEVIPLGV